MDAQSENNIGILTFRFEIVRFERVTTLTSNGGESNLKDLSGRIKVLPCKAGCSGLRFEISRGMSGGHL